MRRGVLSLYSLSPVWFGLQDGDPLACCLERPRRFEIELFYCNLGRGGRFSFRMAKEHCANCPLLEDCFVQEKQKFYSHGFWKRRLEIALRRARVADPNRQEFPKQRAGAESMISEVYHRTGKRTKFTGKIKVKNATVAKAIGTNLKRVSRHLNEESSGQKTAG